MVKKKILLGIITVALLVGVVGAVIVYNFGFKQRFEVVSAANIRVFFDSQETQELQQGNYLDWGQITNTNPKQMTLYIKNVGTVDVTLTFNYDGQQLPQGWSETWDYTGGIVAQGATVSVTITLTLPAMISAMQGECNTWIQATPV